MSLWEWDKEKLHLRTELHDTREGGRSRPTTQPLLSIKERHSPVQAALVNIISRPFFVPVPVCERKPPTPKGYRDRQVFKPLALRISSKSSVILMVPVWYPRKNECVDTAGSGTLSYLPIYTSLTLHSVAPQAHWWYARLNFRQDSSTDTKSSGYRGQRGFIYVYTRPSKHACSRAWVGHSRRFNQSGGDEVFNDDLMTDNYQAPITNQPTIQPPTTLPCIWY